jgi:parvulin-like peptidyl-prolyl isomerase
MAKRLVWLVVVMLGVCLLAGCSGQSIATHSSPARTTRSPSPAATPLIFPTATAAPTYAVPTGTAIPAGALAARVNGEPITLRAYQAARDAYMRQLYQQQIDPASAQGRQALAQADPQLLEMLIARTLVLQYAAQHHLTVTLAQVQQAVRAAGSAQRLAQQVAAADMTMQTYKENLTITNTQLAIVDGHRYSNTEYHVRMILVATQAQAETVYRKLRAHAGFAALAQAVSLDTTSKSNGGDLGFQTTLSLGPVLGPAVARLPLNTISRPIHSPRGYQVVEVLNVLKHVPLTGTALAQAKIAYWQQWYAAYRKEAHVQIYVKF